MVSGGDGRGLAADALAVVSPPCVTARILVAARSRRVARACDTCADGRSPTPCLGGS